MSLSHAQLKNDILGDFPLDFNIVVNPFDSWDDKGTLREDRGNLQARSLVDEVWSGGGNEASLLPTRPMVTYGGLCDQN
jgi:hypothetical protein